MSDEAEVRELLDSVARPVDLEGRLFKTDRERAIATILRAAKGAPLRPAGSRSRWLLGLGLAASLALAASAILALRGQGTQIMGQRSLSIGEVHGLVTLQVAGGNVSASAGNEARAISATTSLVTGLGSGARIRSSDGLNIALFENSRLSLVGLGQKGASSVQLLAGSIRCEVPALAKGQQFSVATPDATVTVHGTAFSVSVNGSASAAQTCVKVEHGEVSVKARSAERLLVGGESWGCASNPSAVAPVPPPIGPRAPAAASSARPTKPKERGGEGKPPAGTLDEENRLFQAGLAAERVGDFRAASRSLEQLLAMYPASPLAADARLALSRVKDRLTRAP